MFGEFGDEARVMFSDEREEVEDVGLRAGSRRHGAERPKLRVEMRSVLDVSEGSDLHVAEKGHHF